MSDAGMVLLGATDRTIWLIGRIVARFTNHRSAEHVEHDLRTLLLQRVVGVALGYGCLFDHDQLRHDPLVTVLVGQLCATVCGRAPLAGKSTLNQLELGRPDLHTVSPDQLRS
jgi:hypothetical protein